MGWYIVSRENTALPLDAGMDLGSYPIILLLKKWDEEDSEKSWVRGASRHISPFHWAVGSRLSSFHTPAHMWACGLHYFALVASYLTSWSFLRRALYCLYHRKSSLLPSAHRPAQVESWESQRCIRNASLWFPEFVWCVWIPCRVRSASQRVCPGSRSGRVCERNLPAKFSLKT